MSQYSMVRMMWDSSIAPSWISTSYLVPLPGREEGLDGVLQDRVQANRYRKLDDKGRPT